MVTAPPVRYVLHPGDDPRAEPERLDRALATLTGLSRRLCRRLLADGRVRLDGRPCRVQSRPVEPGQVVELLPGEGSEEALRPASLPELPVVHRDGWLMAVDKPSGMLSQPAERRAAGELACDEVALLTLALAEGRRPFLRLVHRLDRATSGLLLFALRAETLPALRSAWDGGRVERLYLALVEGEPNFERRRAEAPIGRDPGARWRFRVDPSGRPAATEVEVRSRAAGRTLVACRLTTGRTHQVRVHLASLGHPVVGDRLYGSNAEAPRPWLHASGLALPHPESGRTLRIESEMPEGMRGALDGG